MSERELSNASRKAELFDNLLNSIESQYGWQTDSLERAKFDEWKKNGPTWQKEIISQALIIWDWLPESDVTLMRDIHGLPIEPPFFPKIRDAVWCRFESLPPQPTKDVGRGQVVSEFEKVISSCPDLPEVAREDLLKYLREPHTHENSYRKTVGLGSLPGGKDKSRGDTESPSE